MKKKKEKRKESNGKKTKRGGLETLLEIIIINKLKARRGLNQTAQLQLLERIPRSPAGRQHRQSPPERQTNYE